MARRPSYDFERREREKAKAAKTAERVKAKTGAIEAPDGPEQSGGTPSVSGGVLKQDQASGEGK